MLDALLAILCLVFALIVGVGVLIVIVDIIGAPFRSFRRWEQRQDDLIDAVYDAADHRDEDLEQMQAKLDATARAEEIIRRAGDQPATPPGAGRPHLRLIMGGPDAEPPPDVTGPPAPPPGRPDLPPGPPFPDGSYRLELPDPDGPLLTMWQRNYLRSLLNRRGAKLDRDLRQLTTVEAEKLVAALGGNPRKLYTGGRAWGQKRG